MRLRGWSTPRPPPHHWPVRKIVRDSSTTTTAERRFTYVVACLLVFVALLVRLGLGLIRLALLRIECLPSLTEDLADLA